VATSIRRCSQLTLVVAPNTMHLQQSGTDGPYFLHIKTNDFAVTSTSRARFPRRPQRVYSASIVTLHFRKKRSSVTDPESELLSRLSRQGICPNCGKVIPEGQAVVRGVGRFCGLECVALFHQQEFTERARRLKAASQN
jgi:hypothetical protein